MPSRDNLIIYEYMYIHIYIYIYIYIIHISCTYIYMCTYVYMYIYIYVCTFFGVLVKSISLTATSSQQLASLNPQRKRGKRFRVYGQPIQILLFHRSLAALQAVRTCATPSSLQPRKKFGVEGLRLRVYPKP